MSQTQHPFRNCWLYYKAHLIWNTLALSFKEETGSPLLMRASCLRLKPGEYQPVWLVQGQAIYNVDYNKPASGNFQNKIIILASFYPVSTFHWWATSAPSCVLLLFSAFIFPFSFVLCAHMHFFYRLTSCTLILKSQFSGDISADSVGLDAPSVTEGCGGCGARA